MNEEIKSSLHIRGFELRVFLGWPTHERSEQQTVQLDLTVHFPQPPKACETDNLDDTFCYSQLTQHIQDNVSAQKFFLIEHLCSEIYKSAKSTLPHDSTVKVTITKHPQIPGLAKGVSFSYGNCE